MSSRARELVERIAQMVIVAKCKCAWQRSKSMTHVNCLRIDTWIVEELIEAVALARIENDSSDNSVMYTESLDSLK
ncbi:hypothetical protein GCK72_024226 [Caenorhabditis remanei]|uniref:Uncharacterized protein n=2 Tax=Caenorhabditis TaxID=6237 RepID=A0A6A5FYL7_CAERE|nr:hypothetical protein GCK72_024226 [Caenorhabditis remanei]KAF1747760.1 hypothetical protein GCK72_024226 [Caenorhabditis remanei]